MARNNFQNLMLGIIVILLIVLISQPNGVIQNYFTTQEGSDIPNPDDVPTGDIIPTANLIINFNPDEVCFEDFTVATARSNLANAVCRVFWRTDAEWQVLDEIFILDEDGDYTETIRADAPIDRYFYRMVCLQGESSYAISNLKTLDIVFCPDEDDEAGPEDGEEEEQEQDQQGGMPCESVWNPSPADCQAAVCLEGLECGYIPGDLVMPSRCECMEDEAFCFDTDDEDVFPESTQGTCTDATGSYTDSCATDFYVNENFCSDETGTCLGISAPCPEDWFCIDGACEPGI